MELGEKYWDAFEKRIGETVAALKDGKMPPLRRLSLHITNKCNMACGYCNEKHTSDEISRDLFYRMVREYSEMGGGILHMTGGEPACVSWLFIALAELGPMYTNVDFHLNTNAMVVIPDDALKQIKRLKISLDSCDEAYFNELVGVSNAFSKVINTLNYINALNAVGEGPICSVTYTMSKQNFFDMPKFVQWFTINFPYIYSVFISAYKGHDERFAFTPDDIGLLFDEVVPMFNAVCFKYNLDETKFLFHASHEPATFVSTDRFPINRTLPCYIQLSEMVINEHGEVGNCSHLFRDGVRGTDVDLNTMPLHEAFRLAKAGYDNKPLHDKCAYGCNKKLVTFNQLVDAGIA